MRENDDSPHRKRETVLPKDMGPAAEQAADRLGEAIRAKDPRAVKAGLDELRAMGVNFLPPKAPRKNGSYLMAAALSGEPESVRLLMDWCDPNAVDELKHTALMFATEGGHLEVVKILAPKTNVLALDKNDQSAAEWAMRNDHLPVIEYLASMGGLPKNNALGDSMLVAEIRNHAEKCAFFLMGRCDPKEENMFGDTALRAAIERDMDELAQALAKVSGLGSSADASLSGSAALAFHAVLAGAPKCLALFLPALDWREKTVNGNDEEIDIFDYSIHSEPTPEGKVRCLALLSVQVPLDIAREALAKHGGEALPELMARVEAFDLAQAVADAQSAPIHPPAGGTGVQRNASRL